MTTSGDGMPSRLAGCLVIAYLVVVAGLFALGFAQWLQLAYARVLP